MSARRSPTLEDVAARAGVSRATASRVVNDDPRVRESARAAVAAAIAELGYRPNRAARSLVVREPDSVSVLIHEPDERIFADPFFGGLLRGVGVHRVEIRDPGAPVRQLGWSVDGVPGVEEVVGRRGDPHRLQATAHQQEQTEAQEP